MFARTHCVLIAVSILAWPALAAGEERLANALVAQFLNLNAKAEPLGARRGVADNFPPNLICKHYQGMARSQTPGLPYFFITRSGNTTPQCEGTGDIPGELVVVQLASRGTDGERLRSNRLQLNSRFDDTAPPANDVAVVSIHLDGTSLDGYGNVWPAWCHPGGCQIIDNVLVVPVEHNYATGDATDGGLVLIDVSNPLAPRLIKNFDMDTKIGTVGVTRDPVDGRYLFALGGSYLQDDGIRFIKSAGTVLDGSFGFDYSTEYTWMYYNDQDPGDGAAWDEDGWQCTAFVRDANGMLGLIILSDSNSLGLGYGRARLWEVVQTGNTFDLDLRGSRDMGMTEPTTGDWDAAGSVYVSPSGQLLLYAAEHISEGPGDSIRMGEFRQFDMNVEGTCGCDGWITLYENINGWSDRNSQSHVMDYPDRALEEWNDLRQYEDFSGDLNGFSDEAESVRWNIPPGRIGELHRDENYSGGAMFLDGTGIPMKISNLASYGMANEVTSVRFVDRQPDMYVTNSAGGCPIPGGFGTSDCPYVGTGSIQFAADRIGAPPCFAAQNVYIAPGTYPQDLSISRAMTLRPWGGGQVTISGQ